MNTHRSTLRAPSAATRRPTHGNPTMSLRILSFLAALSLAASVSAGTLRYTESFEEGSNEGGWSGGFVFDGFGFGVGESFPADGGSSGGGAFLFRFAEEFIPEMHTLEGLPSEFTGNWREKGVRSFSADIKTFSYSDFLPEDHPLVINEQPQTTRERHVALMLVHDPDLDVFGDECTMVRLGHKHFTSGAGNDSNAYIPSSRHGDRGLPPRHVNGEPRGNGWRTYSFKVDAASETLPPHWVVPRVDTDVNGDGDPDYFDNNCPADDDEAWRLVTSDVTQVQVRMADPISEAFGIGQFFAYGFDEPTLVLDR